MKKKFVRVMLFGALTLAVSTTVTSCKDYDDDIKNLQEQIDKVTSTNPVSTEDMKAAISSAIQTLQTQLQTAIDGKADSKAVQDLLKTVEALQTALENKADASTIKTLGDQITELSKQVNSIEGTLNETKKDLEAKVADLTEKLAGAASSEDLKKIADELAEAKNELKAVNDMADNNAAAIVEIKANILELQKLDGRITALETFNQNAASKDDLAAYVAHSELAGLVDNEVLELLKDNGSIAKYVNEVIESQVLAETSAINLAIKGVDDKLATLSTNFETYKSEQATAYQTVTSNITTLTTFKTTIETALTNGGYANFEAVLTEISTIKNNYGYCATKEAFDSKVETYLTTYKSEVDGQFNALKARITALENQIQSVVYVPEYEDGKIIFMSYFYDNKLVAETKPIQMKFRISPATAAANFAENYAPSFDGQEIKTRAAEVYNIEKTEVDEATGIVIFTVSTSTDKSFAVSLNLIAKDQSKNLTNISSNYFPVISDYRAITDVKVKSPNEAINYILYDKPLSVVDYATGAVLQITGTDRAGDAITDEPMASSVNAEKFIVSYKVEGTNPDSYTIENGMLKLKTYNDASFNGKTATPKATVTITGTDFNKVTAFTDVTARAASSDPEVSSTISAVQFDGTKEQVADVTVAFGTSGGSTDIGISQAVYEKLPAENFAFKAASGVYLRFKDGTTKNELEIVVPKGTVADTYVPEVKVKVSDVQNFTLKPSITVEVTDANYTLTYDDKIITGGSSLALTANLLPTVKPTSMNFMMEIPSLFGNYATIVDNAKEVGATVQFSLKEAITGVSLADNVLKVDNTYSNPDPAKDIVVVAKVIAKNAAGADIELVTSKETTFTLADLSGEWTAPTATTVKIGSDKVDATTQLATGAIWKASNKEAMWEAGKEVKAGDKWGAAPLGIFGFVAPTFELADAANAKYVTLDKNTGALTLTNTGKQLKAVVSIIVNIVAESRWGTITNYAAGNAVTVKIDPTKESTSIPD